MEVIAATVVVTGKGLEFRVFGDDSREGKSTGKGAALRPEKEGRQKEVILVKFTGVSGSLRPEGPLSGCLGKSIREHILNNSNKVSISSSYEINKIEK
ncbi:hypothetical protein HAX54_041168 [Datura stramonium]|uniref:Uncharacterized protein n=1 Tax=Datura stramonium TaxID=4076 RepID=A0ABS8SKU3_DATST|nr:hypothetical protein [Datura stramonium]